MKSNSNTIRVYTEKGQERFVRPGQIVPKGWFGPDMEVLESEHVVILQKVDDGNPYDQISRPSYRSYLRKL